MEDTHPLENYENSADGPGSQTEKHEEPQYPVSNSLTDPLEPTLPETGSSEDPESRGIGSTLGSPPLQTLSNEENLPTETLDQEQSTTSIEEINAERVSFQGDNSELHEGQRQEQKVEIVLQGLQPNDKDVVHPKKKEEMSDPTVLMEDFDTPYQYPEEIVDSWWDELLSKRILVLTSFHGDSLLSAAHCVASRFDGPKRLLQIEQINEEKRHELNISWLLNPKHKWGKGCLVIAPASGSETTSLVDSIMGRNDNSSPTGVRAQLRTSDRFLILLTTSSQTTDSDFLRGQEVPFLEVYLKRKYPKDSKELLKDIQELHQDRRWNIRSADFVDDLSRCKSVEHLRAEVERRRQGLWFTQENDPSLPISSLLERTVLFIAAFFKDLPVEDFHDLLCILLGDQETAVVPTRLLESSEQSSAEEIRPEKKKLKETWQETYVDILESCSLSIFRSDHQSATLGTSLQAGPVIGFRDSALREWVESEFLTRRYLTQVELFTSLRAKGLMLHEAKSVAEGICYLTQTMARSDRQRYGLEVLKEIAEPLISTTE